MPKPTLLLILTLTCKESTRIVSDSLDRELAWGERWAVRLHAISCWSCRRFRRQILFLREAVRRRSVAWLDAGDGDLPELSGEARKRILVAIADDHSHDRP